MSHRLGLVAALGFALACSAGVSGCSANAQASQAAPVAIAASAYVGMPAPQAPFDETPITPVESAGASRSH